jgi:hypothetical protein
MDILRIPHGPEAPNVLRCVAEPAVHLVQLMLFLPSQDIFCLAMFAIEFHAFEDFSAVLNGLLATTVCGYECGYSCFLRGSLQCVSKNIALTIRPHRPTQECITLGRALQERVQGQQRESSPCVLQMGTFCTLRQTPPAHPRMHTASVVCIYFSLLQLTSVYFSLCYFSKSL